MKQNKILYFTVFLQLLPFMYDSWHLWFTYQQSLFGLWPPCCLDWYHQMPTLQIQMRRNCDISIFEHGKLLDFGGFFGHLGEAETICEQDTDIWSPFKLIWWTVLHIQESFNNMIYLELFFCPTFTLFLLCYYLLLKYLTLYCHLMFCYCTILVIALFKIHV